MTVSSGSRRKLFTKDIVVPAIWASFRKLDPRVQIRNPVMFVVEVGSVITTGIFLADLFRGRTDSLWFTGVVALFLWLTVVFANFAEAVAEGRGRAQANALRATRSEMTARRLGEDGAEERVPAAHLRPGDMVVCEAGDLIPGDGDVVDGVASVERVGHHGGVGAGHPGVRRRPQRRHRRHAGAERPDRGAHHPGARRQLPRPHDHPRRGHRAAQDAQRDRAEHPHRRPDDRLPGRDRDPAPLGQLRRQRRLGDRADRAPRVAHPDDDRRAAVGDRDRRHRPPRAAQRARPERPGGRGGRRRGHPAARQDRHDHAGQPPGDRVHPGRRRVRARARGGCPALVPGRRDPRGTLDRRAREGALRPARAHRGRSRPRVHPLQRGDADERRPDERHLHPQGGGRCGDGLGGWARRGGPRRPRADR